MEELEFAPKTTLMYTRAIIILILSFFIFLQNTQASKQINKKVDESAVVEGEEDYEFEEYEMEGESSIEYEFNGFIDLENFISTYKENTPKETNLKNEIKNNFNFSIVGGNFQSTIDINLYINSNIVDESYNEDYLYSQDFDVSRNVRLSNRSYEIIFNELYFGYGIETLRLRIGNQKYGWGTADGVNPTSYFNPQDFRELLFKDDDETKIPIPSISSMVFLADLTLELVFAPIHVPMLMAGKDTFWAIKYWEGPFPVVADKPEELDVVSKNFGYGCRLSYSFYGIDFSLSGFYGPDVDPVMRPIGPTTIPGESVSLLVRPEYNINSKIGLDFSKTIESPLGNFVTQFETAFSPDKSGVVDQGDVHNIVDADKLEFPFELKKGKYISYSVGFNYFIPLNRIFKGHTGDTILTFEWHESFYLNSDILQPVLSDILTCKFEDSYFSNYLTLSLIAVVDTQNNGLVFIPEIGVDLQNGFALYIAYAYIEDYNEDSDNKIANQSMFGLYKDNDIIIVKARYKY